MAAVAAAAIERSGAACRREFRPGAAVECERRVRRGCGGGNGEGEGGVGIDLSLALALEQIVYPNDIGGKDV